MKYQYHLKHPNYGIVDDREYMDYECNMEGCNHKLDSIFQIGSGNIIPPSSGASATAIIDAVFEYVDMRAESANYHEFYGLCKKIWDVMADAGDEENEKVEKAVKLADAIMSLGFF